MNAIDDGLKVGTLFLDQAKAFETAHHPTLIKKLFNAGVTGKENKWFQSFLAYRQQNTEIEGIRSIPGDLECGTRKDHASQQQYTSHTTTISADLNYMEQ